MAIMYSSIRSVARLVLSGLDFLFAGLGLSVDGTLVRLGAGQ